MEQSEKGIIERLRAATATVEAEKLRPILAGVDQLLAKIKSQLSTIEELGRTCHHRHFKLTEIRQDIIKRLRDESERAGG